MAKSKSQEKREKAQRSQKKVNPLYKEFLNSLSSTEQEVYRKNVEVAMPSFRKFIEAKSDAELVVLVTK